MFGSGFVRFGVGLLWGCFASGLFGDGVGWFGIGWSGVSWVGVGWFGVGRVGSVGLGLVGLGWVGLVSVDLGQVPQMGCRTRAYRKIPLGSARRTWEVRLPDVRPAGNLNATSTPASSKCKQSGFCFQWNHFFPPPHLRISTRNKNKKRFHRTVGIYYNAWINYSIGSVCGINFRWIPVSLSRHCVDKRGNLQVLSRSVAGMVGHSVFACVVGILEVSKNSSGEKKVGKQQMFFDNAEILIFDGTLEFFRGLVLFEEWHFWAGKKAKNNCARHRRFCDHFVSNCLLQIENFQGVLQCRNSFYNTVGWGAKIGCQFRMGMGC